MTEFCDIRKLVELFNPKRDESDSDGEESYTNPKPSTSNENRKENEPKKKKINPYAKISTPQTDDRELFEVNENNEFVLKEDAAQSDWRKTPEWNVSYKQNVTASDVFLQMGLKTPSTASCEDMVVRVDLPGEKRHNIDLKVLQTEIVVVSPNYFLKLPLPQPIDPQNGAAHWNSEESTLIITLRMDRELDVVNF